MWMLWQDHHLFVAGRLAGVEMQKNFHHQLTWKPKRDRIRTTYEQIQELLRKGESQALCDSLLESIGGIVDTAATIQDSLLVHLEQMSTKDLRHILDKELNSPNGGGTEPSMLTETMAEWPSHLQLWMLKQSRSLFKGIANLSLEDLSRIFRRHFPKDDGQSEPLEMIHKLMALQSTFLKQRNASGVDDIAYYGFPDDLQVETKCKRCEAPQR